VLSVVLVFSARNELDLVVALALLTAIRFHEQFVYGHPTTTRAEGGLPWGAFDHETQTFGLELRNGRRESHGHIQKAV
jgi:hypothetical protein